MSHLKPELKPAKQLYITKFLAIEKVYVSLDRKISKFLQIYGKPLILA